MKLRTILILGCVIAASCTQMATELAQAPAKLDHRNAEMVIAAAGAVSKDGLTAADYDTEAIKAALRDNDSGAATAASIELFMKLAKDISEGTIPPAARTQWRIGRQTLAPSAARALADKAFHDHDIVGALNALAPTHPQYDALKAALAKTPADDVAAIAQLRLNMERWRWMPRDLGSDYILVNVPAFELAVVRNNKEIDRRRIIVGAVKSPTPQFAATVTGVSFNPTWYVPASIVAESVGSLLKNNPEKAKQLGYYVSAEGGVRQKPGANNALGQMKLVMPNPYSIFLHDTSSKALFQRDARALSHGCIRVDGALDFAHVLLAPGWDARAIADAVATGTTNTVELERPLPVYVTYFTAYAQGDGSISYPADIYGLDQQLLPRFGFNPATKGAGETNIDAVENCPGEPPA